jgi:hypothetical protein
MQSFRGTCKIFHKDNFIKKCKELIFDNPFQLTLNSIEQNNQGQTYRVRSLTPQ